ncbi:MAG: transglycosylase SLT domain-containing protein [Proteobacteria bacterium]|jgi:hypothetical protein|nr:transglycosylase SLT domain-containing protein [Pseudomonadota bacterium]MDA1136237.1 transglycosylase SLT domain-containing protein [Pseudomonadota bacterium]|tara:strand:+ start:273 stop:968 length:696 start_codon:yes stop_codon:yes gene_type:complete
MSFYKNKICITKLFFILIIFSPINVFASVKTNLVCEKIIKNIESLTGIPEGLLLGIGKTEAGRIIDKKELRVWPWTVNHAGKSLFFDNKKQMKNYVLKHLTKGDNNLDVGCMQVNLKWHKHNFKKVNDMISPEPNISYAASFLVQLKNKYGNWNEAIKNYHSSDPDKNKPYLDKVLSFWKMKDKKPLYIVDNKKNNFDKNESELASIRNRQPYLSERWEKVSFFRKVFLEK